MTRIVVFGYNRGGVPSSSSLGVQDADVLVFDCRRLNNPQRHPQYRSITGKDPEIQAYVKASPGFDTFWTALSQAASSFVAAGEGRDTVIALGCAFGKHRSRAVAHMLRAYLAEMGVEVEPIAPYVFKDGGTD